MYVGINVKEEVNQKKKIKTSKEEIKQKLRASVRDHVCLSERKSVDLERENARRHYKEMD